MKKQKTKEDYLGWKVASIILGITALIILYIIIVLGPMGNINTDKVELSQDEMCGIYNIFGVDKPFQICDVEDNSCSKPIKFKSNPCK